MYDRGCDVLSRVEDCEIMSTTIGKFLGKGV